MSAGVLNTQLLTLLTYAQRGVREHLSDIGVVARAGALGPRGQAELEVLIVTAEGLMADCIEAGIEIRPAFARALEKAKKGEGR